MVTREEILVLGLTAGVVGSLVGGLLLYAGLALVLRYLAGGRYELGETIPIDAGKILGAGLTFAAGTALIDASLSAVWVRA